MTQATIRVPRGLGPAGSGFYRAVAADYQLEPHHRSMLEQAALCIDRVSQCRAAIAAAGVTIEGPKGGVRAHPLLAAERAASRQFMALVHELGLDDERSQRRDNHGRWAGGLGLVGGSRA